ncbi:MAG: hypothetical protein IPM13_03020 [Phycisphaerales bacterium]|nr:hypothetical protein [Phycisphaerales bacterium]
MGSEGGRGRRTWWGRVVGIGLATVLIAAVAAHVWYSIHLEPALPMSDLGARLAMRLPQLENDRSAEVAPILSAVSTAGTYTLPEAPAGYRWTYAAGPSRGRAISGRGDLGPGDALLGPWEPELRQHLAAVIAYLESPDVKAHIDALVELSAADWRLDPWGVLGPRVPSVGTLWRATPVLLARARYEHAQRGDAAAAWCALRAVLAMREHLPIGSFRALGPLLFSEEHALRELGHMLREVPLPAAVADEIARYLDGRPSAEQTWMQAVQGELNLAEALLDAGFTCEPDGDGVLVPGAQLHGVGRFKSPMPFFPAGRSWNVAWFLYHRRPVALSNIRAQADSLARAFRMPPQGRAELFARVEGGQAAITVLDGPMLRSSAFQPRWGGELDNAHAALLAQAAWTQGVRTLLAINRHRAASGELPSELTELLGDWLDELPQDPFGEGPLRYRRDGRDAFTLWSVGPDGRDDGAVRALDFDDVHLVSAKQDIVFTLPRGPAEWEPSLELVDPAAASPHGLEPKSRPATRPADGVEPASRPQED